MKPVSVGVASGREACAIPRCDDNAVETFRLLVNGSDSVLLLCQTHADWLGRYIAEDLEVRLVHRESSVVVGG